MLKNITSSKFCKMITVRRIFISVVVAYMLHILISVLFVSTNSKIEKEISIEKKNYENDDKELLEEDEEFGEDYDEEDGEDHDEEREDYDEEREEEVDEDVEIEVGEADDDKEIDLIGDFKPPCKIHGWQTISAVTRAKTQYCKQKIAETRCLIQKGGYYPEYLPHSCPNNGTQYGRYLGCYADKFDPRILPDWKEYYRDSNTRQGCIDKCFFEGFPYAGVQYAVECFCGNERPPSSSKLPDNACDMACSGAPDEICGGSLTMNVFETGVAKFIPQTPKTPSSTAPKKPVKVVFLLTINGRALRQVQRLINNLYRTHHYIYIHVDAIDAPTKIYYSVDTVLDLEEAVHFPTEFLNSLNPSGLPPHKMVLQVACPVILLRNLNPPKLCNGTRLMRHDYLHRKLSALEKKFPNIKLATPRFTTTWGGISLLKSILSSMKNLLTLGWEWDYLINLSECGFPINSIESLESFLSQNKGLNFVAHHDRKYDKNPGLYESFVECEERMWRIGGRIPPKTMITAAGSDWYTLSREFISYVVGPKDEFLTGIERFYNQSLYAAEAYFHHILRNTHFCNTYVNNNLHLINWDWIQGCKCAYRHIVDWCGCSPMDFKPKDWARLRDSINEPFYFARKFEPIINQEIINKVEKFIGADDHDIINNLDAYWENLFDFEDYISSKDDLFISHAKSITRINARKLINEGCDLVPKEVLEINLFKKADAYEGNLVLHKANFESNDIILETLYKPKKMELNPDSEFDERIKMFKVSSQYDQKEQVFRNFADILGPFTEPVLVYEIAPKIEKTEYFVIYWLDPAGRIASSNEIHVNNGNYTNFINSNLPTPILPGMWKIGLFHDSQLIVQTKFLITPFECFLRKDLSPEKAFEINGGSHNFYPQLDGFKTSDFFPKEDASTGMREVSAINAKKTNEGLREWIDELSTQYYDIIKSCVSQRSDIKVPIRCGENVIDVCELTEWSSLSPDPKGSVGKLNKKTGKLERV